MHPAAASPVNIDALPNVAGYITAFGESHAVLDLDGNDYKLINENNGGVIPMYPLIAKIVPTLGPERVLHFTAKQVTAIIAIADGRIQEVEAAFPNGHGATSESPAPPV